MNEILYDIASATPARIRSASEKRALPPAESATPGRASVQAVSGRLQQKICTKGSRESQRNKGLVAL